jgi:hypothetical protein
MASANAGLRRHLTTLAGGDELGHLGSATSVQPGSVSFGLVSLVAFPPLGGSGGLG